MKNKDDIMTAHEGLAAMYEFWNPIWERTRCGGIGLTAGDMTLTYDYDGGTYTFDQAAWYDWLACVMIAKTGKTNTVRWRDDNVKYDRNPSVDKPWVIVDYKPMDDDKTTLTAKEAFAAMCNFWDEAGERMESVEIQRVLKEIDLQDDDTTANAELWEQWLSCVEKAKAGQVDNTFKLYPKKKSKWNWKFWGHKT